MNIALFFGMEFQIHSDGIPFIWNGNSQKCQNITQKAQGKADTGTTEPAPTDPLR